MKIPSVNFQESEISHAVRSSHFNSLPRKIYLWLMLLACFAGVNALKVEAQTTFTTVNGASGNWTTATNWAGGIYANGAGNGALFGSTAGSVTMILDVPVTLGIIRNGQGGGRNWVINANGTNAVTMDNTGGAANNKGDTNAYIGSTSSGSLTFNPNIIIQNTDLDFQLSGSTTPPLTIGTLGVSTITATSPRNLILFNDAPTGGSAAKDITINSRIGATGSSITISNMGTSVALRSAIITGIIGPNASVVQNSTVSPLRLSAANTYTGNTMITAGTLQLGAANAIPSASSVSIETGGVLNLAGFSDIIGDLSGSGMVTNTSATAVTLTIGGNNLGGTFSGTILNNGALSLTKTGNGTEILTGANTYTGTTAFNGGVLTAGSVDSPGVSGPFGSSTAAGSIVFGGGTLQYSATNQQDYSARFSTAVSQAISIDTAGQNVTFATALTSSGGSLTKTGNGTLTLSAPETYNGNTTVNGGVLALGASASLSASSTIIIGAGGTFDVSALGASTTYTLGSSAALKASGAGTVVGSNAATLIAGSTGTFDLGSRPVSLTWSGASSGNDSTHPSLYFPQGTLNLNNNTITVVVPGAPLDVGVYTLITASGITGTPNPIPSFTGGNGLQAGKFGSISVSGASLILTVSGSSAVLGTWSVNADGNWAAGANWSSNPNFPRASGDVATLGVGSALRTITLNAAVTNGTLNFTNDNSFVIANGGFPLTLNNSAAGATINVSGGTQNDIAAPVSLSDNVAITIASNKTLSISGAIANSGAAKTLSVSGGTLALSGNNSYGPSAGSVGTTLSGGTLQLGNATALGAGDLNINGSSTLRAGANLSVGNNITLGFGVIETVDNNGNSLTLGGVLSGAGALTKTGNGTLVLSGLNTYSGGTIINAGTVSVSTGGASPGDPSNLGAVPASVTANNLIINGGDLLGTGSVTLNANRGIGIGATGGSAGTNALIDAATGATFTINGPIASAGNGGVNGLIVNSVASSPGTVVLGGANTFNGPTIIASGTLQLENPLALQNSALNYNSGALAFGNITAATLGGISGSQNLVLQNASAAGVALTVGGNNVSTNYSGNLSGPGSLIKDGTGTLTVSNANYTGNTTVNSSGSLQIKGGSFGSSSSTITVGNGGGNASLVYSGNGTLTANVANIAPVANSSGSSISLTGAVSAAFTTLNLGGAGNTTGANLINTLGTITISNLNIFKDVNGTGPFPATGLVIQNGTVTANTVVVGTVANGSADLNITGGSLTIGNSSSTGAFQIGNAANARGGWLTMSNGVLNYLGTDGLLMGNIAGSLSGANIYGGTANLSGITLDALGGTTSRLILSDNGKLYLGSIGLVVNAADLAPVPVLLGGDATLGALADWSSAANITLTNNAVLKTADAGNVPHNISLSGTLSGTGGFTKIGGGTLTLSGVNTYTGSTIISNAVLALTGSGNISSSDITTVSSGATLDVSGTTDGTLHVGSTVNQTLNGAGTLTGNLSVESLGTLSPGIGIGNLTVSGSVTLAGATVMEISHGSVPNSDQLVSPAITAGGMLTVTNVGGALQAGDSFKLFSTPISGAFVTVDLPSTDTVTWTNKLAIDGTIAVLTAPSSVNTNPTNITAQASGGQLTLTWPADHIGWRLQAQTNSLNVGLKTNWVDVAGSTLTNRVDVPISTANGAVFFRLIYP